MQHCATYLQSTFHRPTTSRQEINLTQMCEQNLEGLQQNDAQMDLSQIK